MQKDLRNVLLTFGSIAAVLFIGSDVYFRQAALLSFEKRESELSQMEVATELQVPDITELYNALISTTTELTPQPATHTVQAIEPKQETIVIQKKPEPVSAAKVEPAASRNLVLTDAELAAIQAQIADLQKKTAELTNTAPVKTTTVKNTSSNTTSVKASRRSRAS